MIKHGKLGDMPFTRSRNLKLLINSGQVKLGGNAKLKIYGTLNCKSGKRMKVANRVFFESEAEAIGLGFRPCGHCMVDKYREWKRGN